MKTSTIFFLALSSTSFALALPPVNIKLPNTFFGLMALRSASPIHFGTIQANHGNLWIGKTPSTYCPGVEGLNCSGVVTNRTTYQISDTVLSLGVKVPGGQEIYIHDCGLVGYTTTNDPTIPRGATTTGWALETGAQFSLLSHVNGTYFCPPLSPRPSGHDDDDDDDDDDGDDVSPAQSNLAGPWQFYVGVAELPKECLYASLVAQGSDRRVTAYEYS